MNSSIVDGNDVTLAADGKNSDPEAAGVAMRELMKAHVEHANEQTPIERILDSTWFLVTALAAIILGRSLLVESPAAHRMRICWPKGKY